MLEERYCRLMANIQPQDILVSRTLEAAARPTVRHAMPGLRLTAAAACFVALALIAAFAFLIPPKDIVASNGELPGRTEDFLPLASAASYKLASPIVQGLLAGHVPELAGAFIPVGARTSHDGLTFEIVAACLDDGKPVILTALTGERVDQHTVLSLSFDWKSVYDEYSSVTQYDSACSTLFILTWVTKCDAMSPGDQLTVSFYNVGFQTPYEYVIHPEIDLAASSSAPVTQTVRAYRTDYPEDYLLVQSYISSVETETTALVPGEPLLTCPNGSTVSAAGIINGKLHVQTRHPALPRTFEHDGQTVYAGDGSYLTLSVMPRTAEKYSINYVNLVESAIGWTDASGQYAYTEYVLRIDPDELGSYVLRTTYKAPGEYLDGEWDITFPLPSS